MQRGLVFFSMLSHTKLSVVQNYRPFFAQFWAADPNWLTIFFQIRQKVGDRILWVAFFSIPGEKKTVKSTTGEGGRRKYVITGKKKTNPLCNMYMVKLAASAP